MPTPHAPPKDRGAAAVEFALVVPMLLMVVFSIISFGFMLSFRQGLSQAAAEGARAAAVEGDASLRDDDAAAAVNDALAANGIECLGTELHKDGVRAGTCTVGAAAPCAGQAQFDCVTVTLTYAYRDHPAIPSLPLVGSFMPRSMSYSATARVS